MVVVAGSFAFADIVLIKALGIGVAIAVALDATVVRALLVPATMRLLGEWNWWMPARLERSSAHGCRLRGRDRGGAPMRAAPSPARRWRRSSRSPPAPVPILANPPGASSLALAPTEPPIAVADPLPVELPATTARTTD